MPFLLLYIKVSKSYYQKGVRIVKSPLKFDNPWEMRGIELSLVI